MNNIDLTHDILNGLDPALIEQASHTVKNRMPNFARMALAAACLCIVLLGSAMAAEELLKNAGVQRYFSGSEFSGVMQQIDPLYQPIPGNEDRYSGYVILWEGRAVSLENMSEAVQELVRNCSASGGGESMRFASAAEMQSFLGLTLYENAVLDQLELRAAENLAEAVYDEEGNLLAPGNEVVGAVLNCIRYENGVSRLDMLSFCGLNNGALEITVTAEVVSVDLENSNGTAFVFDDGTQFSDEAYVTANGDEITIIRCDVPKGCGNAPYTEYSAHFHAYGVRYHVRIVCLEESEECRALMKEILDAFEFNELS